MKVFKASPSAIAWEWREAIEEIEADRETNESYWVNGKRFAKKTNYDVVFNSYEQARQHLIDHFTKRVERFEEQILEEKENLKKATNL